MAGWDVEIGKKCEKCVYWLPPMPFENNLRISLSFSRNNSLAGWDAEIDEKCVL